MRKKVLRGAIIDFFIIAILYFTVSLSVFGFSKLLYSERSVPSNVTVITQELDFAYEGALETGDRIYDTLTKACLGSISELDILYTDTGIRYKITFYSKSAPRADALRTAKLWFRYQRL